MRLLLQDGKRVKTVEGDRFANQLSSESASYYILEYDICIKFQLEGSAQEIPTN
jgi:hypothetical protein